ncbi:MAG: ankyrin repeat domain-containing protein [Candidatus Dependentiae bacterium]|nr:ankyrin repeat domain-containing protein [Candidatus Dependentiae bacterium]
MTLKQTLLLITITLTFFSPTPTIAMDRDMRLIADLFNITAPNKKYNAEPLDEALFAATSKSKVQSVKSLLMQGADINYSSDCDDGYPLMLAARMRPIECFEYLLRSGARIYTKVQTDENGIISAYDVARQQKSTRNVLQKYTKNALQNIGNKSEFSKLSKEQKLDRYQDKVYLKFQQKRLTNVTNAIRQATNLCPDIIRLVAQYAVRK